MSIGWILQPNSDGNCPDKTCGWVTHRFAACLGTDPVYISDSKFEELFPDDSNDWDDPTTSLCIVVGGFCFCGHSISTYLCNPPGLADDDATASEETNCEDCCDQPGSLTLTISGLFDDPEGGCPPCDPSYRGVPVFTNMNGSHTLSRTQDGTCSEYTKTWNYPDPYAGEQHRLRLYYSITMEMWLLEVEVEFSEIGSQSWLKMRVGFPDFVPGVGGTAIYDKETFSNDGHFISEDCWFDHNFGTEPDCDDAVACTCEYSEGATFVIS